MTVVQRSAFAPFKAEQMFALVNDIAAYPEFLPWCVGADVLVAEDVFVEARLTVKKGRFDYAFTTANRLVPGRTIELSLVERPFRKLNGKWQFTPADGGCLVNFKIEFEFRGRLLGTALSLAFKPITDSLLDAFRTRAYDIYRA
jgi:ribosome-associated toxin RatA of RatAB toxin-antitoxin module